jgi:hypothetical protein
MVVDRAIRPRYSHILVAVVDGEFTAKHGMATQNI